MAQPTLLGLLFSYCRDKNEQIEKKFEGKQII